VLVEERERLAVGGKKTKKAVESVNSKIQLVMKSGKDTRLWSRPCV
jgi:hypothetical protein